MEGMQDRDNVVEEEEQEERQQQQQQQGNRGDDDDEGKEKPVVIIGDLDFPKIADPQFSLEKCMHFIKMNEMSVQLLDRLTEYLCGDSKSAMIELTSKFKFPFCQFEWTKRTYFFRCKDCALTETSCVCLECFKKGNHIRDGHSFMVEESNLGGCCDCGNPDSFYPKGFCSDHFLPEKPEHPPSKLDDGLRKNIHILVRILFIYLKECIQILQKGDSTTNIEIVLSWLDDMARKSFPFFYIISEEVTQQTMDPNHFKLYSPQPLPYLDILDYNDPVDFVSTIIPKVKTVTSLLEIFRTLTMTLLGNRFFKMYFCEQFLSSLKDISLSEDFELRGLVSAIACQMFELPSICVPFTTGYSKQNLAESLIDLQIELLERRKKYDLDDRFQRKAYEEEFNNNQDFVYLINICKHDNIVEYLYRYDHIIDKFFSIAKPLQGICSFKRQLIQPLEYELPTISSLVSVECQSFLFLDLFLKSLHKQNLSTIKYLDLLLKHMEFGNQKSFNYHGFQLPKCDILSGEDSISIYNPLSRLFGVYCFHILHDSKEYSLDYIKSKVSLQTIISMASASMIPFVLLKQDESLLWNKNFNIPEFSSYYTWSLMLNDFATTQFISMLLSPLYGKAEAKYHIIQALTIGNATHSSLSECRKEFFTLNLEDVIKEVSEVKNNKLRLKPEYWDHFDIYYPYHYYEPDTQINNSLNNYFEYLKQMNHPVQEPYPLPCKTEPLHENLLPVLKLMDEPLLFNIISCILLKYIEPDYITQDWFELEPFIKELTTATDFTYDLLINHILYLVLMSIRSFNQYILPKLSDSEKSFIHQNIQQQINSNMDFDQTFEKILLENEIDIKAFLNQQNEKEIKRKKEEALKRQNEIREKMKQQQMKFLMETNLDDEDVDDSGESKESTTSTTNSNGNSSPISTTIPSPKQPPSAINEDIQCVACKSNVSSYIGADGNNYDPLCAIGYSELLMVKKLADTESLAHEIAKSRENSDYSESLNEVSTNVRILTSSLIQLRLGVATRLLHEGMSTYVQCCGHHIHRSCLTSYSERYTSGFKCPLCNHVSNLILMLDTSKPEKINSHTELFTSLTHSDWTYEFPPAEFNVINVIYIWKFPLSNIDNLELISRPNGIYSSEGPLFVYTEPEFQRQLKTLLLLYRNTMAMSENMVSKCDFDFLSMMSKEFEACDPFIIATYGCFCNRSTDPTNIIKFAYYRTIINIITSILKRDSTEYPIDMYHHEIMTDFFAKNLDKDTKFTKKIEKRIKPFLRKSYLFYLCYNTPAVGVIENPYSDIDITLDSFNNIPHLLSKLNLPSLTQLFTDKNSQFYSIPSFEKVQNAYTLTSISPKLPKFIDIPDNHINFLIEHITHNCKENCEKLPKGVCLLCGDVVCLGSTCCPEELSKHSNICGGYQGVYLGVFSPEVTVHISSFPSAKQLTMYIYYDKFDEASTKSKPSLTLKEESLRKLYCQWLKSSFHQKSW
eukprot:gene9089-11139_t